MRWFGTGTVQYDAGIPGGGRGGEPWSRPRLFIGIGGVVACADSGVAIQTMALGSCIGLCAHDPRQGVIAMAHIALPAAAFDPERAQDEPGRYADTALPALLRCLIRCGGDGSGRTLRLTVMGGASVLADSGLYDIGRRNVTAVREVLSDHGLRAVAEDVGGTTSRTVVLEPGGRVRLSCPGRPEWFL